ncbi:hypothetical protein [Haliangium sp.]|uniref:hypothetical protein n=1 Tax=Haliangium sp. TaxID=2663208 RepID=UPI003D1226FA
MNRLYAPTDSTRTSPRRPDRRPPGVLVGLAAAALALIACGGSAPPPPTPAQSETPSATPATPLATAPTQADQPVPIATPTPPTDEPAAAATPTPVVLERPPFEAFVADELSDRSPRTGRRPKLVQVSVQRNQITDDERWFQDNELALPETSFALADPATPRYEGLPLWRRIDSDLVLSIYGSFNSPRAIITGAASADAEPDFIFDFATWTMPPEVKPGDESFIAMEIPWAWVDGDRLYVCHAHRTYAESSGGKNAYLSAVRIPDGKLLWRTRPLVANARNFALVEAGDRRVLVTGYGFTAEPDFLYLIDPDTGAILNQTKLRKGASHIIPKDDKLYVRTYDRDYVFRIRP